MTLPHSYIFKLLMNYASLCKHKDSKRVEKLAVTYAKHTEREMGWKERESAGRTAWQETKRHLIWNLQCCSVIFTIKLNAWVVRFNMHAHPLKFNRNKKPRYWATVYTNVILPEQLDIVRKWARKVLKILYGCFFNYSRGWFLLKLWIFVSWFLFPPNQKFCP